MREPASITYFQMVNLCEKLISCITNAGCDGPCRSVAEQSYPHAQGQGQRPGGATTRRRSGAAAGRSYHTPEIRGGGQERWAATAQEWLRGATPLPRSGAVTESARLRQAQERQRGATPRQRGATPRPRSGAVATRSNPVQGAAPCGQRRAERSYSTFKVRRGSLRRCPLAKVKETQVRW